MANAGLATLFDGLAEGIGGYEQGQQTLLQRQMLAAQRQQQMAYQNGRLQIQQEQLNRETKNNQDTHDFQTAQALGGLASKYSDQIGGGMAPGDALNGYMREASILPGVDLGKAKDFAVNQWRGSSVPPSWDPDANLSPQDGSQAVHPRVAPQPPLLQKGGAGTDGSGVPNPNSGAAGGPIGPAGGLTPSDMGGAPGPWIAPAGQSSTPPVLPSPPSAPSGQSGPVGPNAPPSGGPVLPPWATSPRIPGLNYNDPAINNYESRIYGLQQQIAQHPNAWKLNPGFETQIDDLIGKEGAYLGDAPTRDLAQKAQQDKEYSDYVSMVNSSRGMSKADQVQVIANANHKYPQFAGTANAGWDVPESVLAQGVPPSTTSGPAFSPAMQAQMRQMGNAPQLPPTSNNGGPDGPIGPDQAPPVPSMLLTTPMTRPPSGPIGPSAIIAGAQVDRTTPGVPPITAPYLNMSLIDQQKFAADTLANKQALLKLREEANTANNQPLVIQFDNRIKAADAAMKEAGVPFAGGDAQNNSTILANRAATSAPGYVKPGSAGSKVTIGGMTRAQVSIEVKREQDAIDTLQKQNDYLSTPDKKFVASATQLTQHPAWKSGQPLSPRGFSGQFEQQYQSNSDEIARRQDRIHRLMGLDSQFDSAPSTGTTSGNYASPTAKGLVGYVSSAVGKVVPDDQSHWCGQFLSNAYRASSGITDPQSVSYLASHNRIQPGPDGSIPNGTGVYWPNSDPNQQHFGIYANGKVYESTTQGAPAGKRVIQNKRTIADVSAAHGGEQPIFFSFPPASQAKQDVQAGQKSAGGGQASASSAQASSPKVLHDFGGGWKLVKKS